MHVDVRASELRARHEEVDAALGRLERAGLARILAPFLVLRLRMWLGRARKRSRSRRVAYSKLSANRLSESYRPVDDALLNEILDTLGETDRSSFEGAIRNFPPAVIHKALDCVRRARSLRRNRTALFRYLLTKPS